MIKGFRCKYDIDIYCESDKCDKCVHHPMYEQGRADAETELKPLLNAIKFTLEDYSTRLGNYAKVIDDKLKEQKNEKR